MSEEIIESLEILDVKDRLVVLRVDNVSTFLSSSGTTLRKLRDILKEKGASSVIVLPKGVDIEKLSNSDLLRMGLARVESDLYGELQRT